MLRNPDGLSLEVTHDMRTVAQFVLRDLWESPMNSMKSPTPGGSASFDGGGSLSSPLIEPVTPPTSISYDLAGKIPPMPQKPRSPAKRIRRLSSNSHEDPTFFWSVNGEEEGEAFVDACAGGGNSPSMEIVRSPGRPYRRSQSPTMVRISQEAGRMSLEMLDLSGNSAGAGGGSGSNSNNNSVMDWSTSDVPAPGGLSPELASLDPVLQVTPNRQVRGGKHTSWKVFDTCGSNSDAGGLNSSAELSGAGAALGDSMLSGRGTARARRYRSMDAVTPSQSDPSAGQGRDSLHNLLSGTPGSDFLSTPLPQARLFHQSPGLAALRNRRGSCEASLHPPSGLRPPSRLCPSSPMSMDEHPSTPSLPTRRNIAEGGTPTPPLPPHMAGPVFSSESWELGDSVVRPPSEDHARRFSFSPSYKGTSGGYEGMRMSPQDRRMARNLLARKALAGGSPTGPGGCCEEARSFHNDFFGFSEIGRGSFGKVYKCTRKMDYHPYAVKEVVREFGSGRDKERMLKEIYALSAVTDNVHVVRYYNAWEEDGKLYIQMELCVGTLAHVWARDGPLTDGALRVVTSHIATGLAFIHGSGMAHLDVKPENIHKSAAGIYKLGDLGLASPADAASKADEGDKRYLSREMLQSDTCDLRKADVFSLGASLYEVASPNPLPSHGDAYHAIRDGSPPPSPPPSRTTCSKSSSP